MTAAGAAVPNATVTLTNTDTGETKTFTTNEVGIYDTVSTPTGNYNISFAAPGFKKLVRGPIVLQVNVITQDAALEVGAVTETVNVEAEGVPLLETETAHLVSILESKTIGDSKVSFDSAVYDQTHNFELRQREFAWLNIYGDAPRVAPQGLSSVLAPKGKIQKLVGGFFNISGGAVDLSGNLFFVDAHRQTIYSWSVATGQLTKVRDNPLDPVQLLFDRSGNLMVVSYAGKGAVYSFRPGVPDAEITLLQAVPSQPRPGMTAVLPPSYWRNENDFREAIPGRKAYQYISSDGTTFFQASRDFVNGDLYYGSKLNDTLRAFGFAPVVMLRLRTFPTNRARKPTWARSVPMEPFQT